MLAFAGIIFWALVFVSVEETARIEKQRRAAIAQVLADHKATLTEQALIDFCRGRIANYKIPRAIYFISAAEWPMSATKVNKRELRARLAAIDRR